MHSPKRSRPTSVPGSRATTLNRVPRMPRSNPPMLMCALPCRLLGADDLEVLVDEDVVRPVDADVVDLVLAVAQLHNTVDDTPWVGGQRGFRRLIRCRAANERPRPLTVVRRDLTDRL